MTRSGILFAIALMLSPLTRANAGWPEPICRAPSVLDVMARELHKRDHYAQIEPRLIAEVPDATQNTVLCGVAVSTIIYDARIAFGTPFGRCEQHAFRVRALQNGFVVRYLR